MIDSQAVGSGIGIRFGFRGRRDGDGFDSLCQWEIISWVYIETTYRLVPRMEGACEI